MWKARMMLLVGAEDSEALLLESADVNDQGHVKRDLSFKDSLMGGGPLETEFIFDSPIFNEFEDEGDINEELFTIRIPNNDKARLHLAWRNALIVRSLGKSFPYFFMVQKLQQLWARKGSVGIWDIGFGDYVVKFESLDDYERAIRSKQYLLSVSNSQ
ncbi:hypothetical protein LINPERHAP2_LOCUS28731 [Linum perenne]